MCELKNREHNVQDYVDPEHLPSVFDLLLDIKSLRDLEQEFNGLNYRLATIKRLMKQYNIYANLLGKRWKLSLKKEE